MKHIQRICTLWLLLSTVPQIVFAQGPPGAWQNLGPYGISMYGSGRVFGIDFHPSDADKIYVGGYGGAWKSVDGGENFTLMNTDSDLIPISTVGSIAVDQGDVDFIYLTTGTPVTSSLYEWSPHEWAEIATAGVYRSIDGGDTWSDINSGLPSTLKSGKDDKHINRIVLEPFDNTDAYIMTDIGLYKCSNIKTTAGTPTWDEIDIPFTNEKLFDLQFAPSSTDNNYVAYLTGEEGVAYTDDFENWTMITGTNPGQIDITAEDEYGDVGATPMIAYFFDMVRVGGVNVSYIKAMLKGDGYYYVFLYKHNNTNGWELVSIKNFTGNAYEGAAAYSNIVIDPGDTNRVFMGGGFMHYWNNNSDTWTTMTSPSTYQGAYAHADHRFIKISPLNSYQHLYTCNDGFVSKLDIRDSPITIETIDNAGLCPAFIAGLSVHPTDADYFIIGSLDDGNQVYNHGFMTSSYYLGSDPRRISFGDGFHPYMIDYNTLLYNYNNSWDGTPHTYKDPGAEVTLEELPNGEKDGFDVNRNVYPSHIITGTTVNVLRDNPFYVVANNVHMYQYDAFNGKPMYERTLSSFNTDFSITSMAVYEKDPSIAYLVRGRMQAERWDCASACTKLYKTTNLTVASPTVPTWTEINLGSVPAYTHIVGVVVSPIDPNVVVIAFTNTAHNSYRVKVSYDGGSSWSNYNMPSDIPYEIHCIAYEAGSKDGIYLGTSSGVYYTNKELSAWETFNWSLAKGVVIRELEVTEPGNRITAATWGRGVWQNYLYCNYSTNLTPSTTVTAPRAYDTKGNIQSTSIIQSTNVTYRAGTFIKLEPGFHVNSGSNFRAWTQPCGGNSIGARVATSLGKDSEIEKNLQELEQERTPVLHVSPNPTQGIVKIVMDPNYLPQSKPEFFIYNIKGQAVSGSVQGNDETREYELDLSGQQTGFYILKVVIGNNMLTEKIMLKTTFSQPDSDRPGK